MLLSHSFSLSWDFSYASCMLNLWCPVRLSISVLFFPSYSLSWDWIIFIDLSSHSDFCVLFRYFVFQPRISMFFNSFYFLWDSYLHCEHSFLYIFEQSCTRGALKSLSATSNVWVIRMFHQLHFFLSVGDSLLWLCTSSNPGSYRRCYEWYVLKAVDSVVFLWRGLVFRFNWQIT